MVSILGIKLKKIESKHCPWLLERPMIEKPSQTVARIPKNENG